MATTERQSAFSARFMAAAAYDLRVPRVLLLLPTTTYRASDFLAASATVGAEVTVASEEPSTLASRNPAGLLTLDFRHPGGVSQQGSSSSRGRHPIDASVGVDEETALAAAAIGERARAGGKTTPARPPRAAR